MVRWGVDPTRALFLLAVALIACKRPATVPAARSGSELSLFVEGLCPKLEIYHAGDRTMLVYGSYGLDERDDATAGGAALGARQAFAVLSGTTPIVDVGLFEGLPRIAGGWIGGDIEMGGRWPDAFWVALVEAARRKGGGGALFERRRSYYSWEGTWQLGARARQRATLGTALPDLPENEICKEGLRFANYATARSPSGDTIVAGRCEDSLGRSPDGIEIASYLAGSSRWRIESAPPSELFADIVNMALVIRSRSEAYLYAYPPYVSDRAAAYLVRFDGTRYKQVPLPFEGPLVALTAADDGALWAITGWRTLRRFSNGVWQRVSLPPPRFVDPVPDRIRLLDVQSVAGAVWVHAAYPALLEGKAARGHLLYTTREVASPLHCDRRRAPHAALLHRADKLQGADELK
jgi:hypothetical protein